MGTDVLHRLLITTLCVAVIGPSSLAAQEAAAEQPDGPGVFTAEAVTRTAQAINYKEQGGKAKVIFGGTPLAKYASGQATVQTKGTVTQIEAKFSGLPRSQKFGPEYLTYVFWAVSPEDGAVNLGELQRDKLGDAKLTATTELQIFGMVVTAEPYYAVRTPSDVIVAESGPAKGAKGRASLVDAKYELLKRGAYEKLVNPLGLVLDLKSNPIDIYQARNALTIAESVGANEYALDALKRAEASLEMTNSPLLVKGRRKELINLARQAVEFAEHARALAIERISEKQQQ
jgi:hypothetical protein